MKDYINKSVKANWIEGIQTLTGNLVFKNDSVIFKANSINGVMMLHLIRYDDIISVELKKTFSIFPNAIVIKTKQCKEYYYVVPNRKDIVAFLKSKIVKEGE